MVHLLNVVTDDRALKTLSGKLDSMLSDKSNDVKEDIPENTFDGKLDMLLADRVSYRIKMTINAHFCLISFHWGDNNCDDN